MIALRPSKPPSFSVVRNWIGLVVIATSAWAGTSNSLMDISADGQLLVCANRDSGTLSVVDLNSRRQLHEVDVGLHPEGVSFLGESHQVAVAVYGDDRVVFVDADSAKKIGSVAVFDEPYGVVANASGDRVFVTLDYPGQVVEIDTRSREVVRSLDVGRFLRGIAISATEQRLYLTEYYTTVVRAIDLQTGQEVDVWRGIRTDNLARQITLNPRRSKAYLPHIRSRVNVAHGSGSIFPYLTVVDTRRSTKRRRTRVPMDAFLGNLVTANPWEVGVSPDGRQLFVVFAGTNDMFACDILDDDYREIDYREYVKLGQNPRAVRVSPDGRVVYVYNALDFEVTGYDTSSLEPVSSIKVCDSPLPSNVHRGKVLFYSALQPMVGRRWISCGSCHPDGQSDGRTWQNPEGLRNTQSLSGLAWTHPIHWSADRDEVQDFEHTIRGKLMQGRGLIQGAVEPSLGSTNQGRSDDLDALAAYTNSHEFSLSPFAKDGLSDTAQQGRAIFFSDQTGCGRCHGGPFYSDSVPRKAASIIRHDVGTGGDDPTELMGPAFDTPTLLGVYRTAPYLHHGKAATLEEVFTTYNRDDRHGVTSQLSADDISHLVEFLKSLPYEDPTTEGEKQGIKRIGDGVTK